MLAPPSGQCLNFSPRRAVVVTFRRATLNCGPAEALVYVAADYECQEEDAALVREAFGGS